MKSNWNKAVGPLDADSQHYCMPELNPEHPVKAPHHYTANSMECKDVSEVCIEGYKNHPVVAGYLMQCCQYIYRAPHKGRMLQDLEKAKEVIQFAIDDLKGTNLRRP